MIDLVKTWQNHEHTSTKDAVLGDMLYANVCKAILTRFEIKAVLELASPTKVSNTIHMRMNAAMIINVENVAGGRFAAGETRE